jgi:hypothetical protein
MLKKKQRKSFAFLFYSEAWIAGTRTLNFFEKSVYIDLLCLQHANNGLDSDRHRLAIAVANGHVEDFYKFWDDWLEDKFPIAENGKRYNERLSVEAEKSLKYIEAQRNNGKKGAEKRWNSIAKNSQSDSHGYTESDGNAKNSPSLSDSQIDDHSNSNSNSSINKNNRAAIKELKTEKNPEDHFSGSGPREFLIQGSLPNPLRVVLTLDGGDTSKSIFQLLNRNLDTWFMNTNLSEKNHIWQEVTLQIFFSEKLAQSGGYNSGKYFGEFSRWYANSQKIILAKVKSISQGENWFKKEMEKVKAKWPNNSQIPEFEKYYLRHDQSGEPYFKSINNFDVVDSFEKWKLNNSKKGVINGKEKNTSLERGVVIPNGTIEEKTKFYNQ